MSRWQFSPRACARRDAFRAICTRCARIESLDSFPDHDEQLKYFLATGGKKNKVYLVHGEKECTGGHTNHMYPKDFTNA